MNKRILRRIGIVALVLVLLFNTMGAQASTDEPTVTVSGYWELVNAVAEAKTGDVIGVTGKIEIQLDTMLGDGNKSITIKRMDKEATLVLNSYPNKEGSSTFKNITFDGNSTDVGGVKPFVQVNHNAVFNMCDFLNCFNDMGNGGALYIANGDVTINSCGFEGNSADNGSHIYNISSGVLQIDNSGFKDGWANELGGGLFLASPSTTYLKSSSVTDNHSRIGGGVYNSGYLNIEGSIICQNEAVIQGADIANEGSMEDSTTEEQYSSWLESKGLYFVGWADDTNTSVGGAGSYKKMVVTDEDPSSQDTTEPSSPDTPSEGEDQEPVDPSPTEPSTEETQPSSTDEPTEPQEPSGADTGDDNTTPTTPSTTEEDKGGSNNSVVGNSTTNNSSSSDSSGSGNTTDSSTHSSSTTTDSSTHSSTANTTTDNSTHSQSTDNSYRDSSSSTVNNYYQQEDKESSTAPQNASQPVNVSVPVTLSIPEQKEADTGATEAVTATATPQQNIKIDAEGVDLVYEYGDNGVTISIKATKEAESTTPEVTTVSAEDTATKEAEKPQNSPNWVEVVTMILLAVLVLAEAKDKLQSKG